MDLAPPDICVFFTVLTCYSHKLLIVIATLSPTLTMDVAQLAEWSASIPEVLSSNPVIGKFLQCTFLLLTEAVNGPFCQKTFIPYLLVSNETNSVLGTILLINLFFFCLQQVSLLGGRPGLLVMGGDPCAKGREFKSRHHILDGHFSHFLL